MKRFIIISLILTGCCSRAKIDTVTKVPVDTKTKKVCFTETHEVDSTSQLELYSRGREWFAKSFVSSKAVLEMDDKEAGKMIGKGFSLMPEMGKTHVMYFTVSVYVKDGKYKSEFTDISYEYDEYIPFSGGQTVKKTFYPEGIITPDAFNDCPCIAARTRAKWRDITMKKIADFQLSLLSAMQTDNTF